MRRKNRLKVLLVILVSIFIMFSAAVILMIGWRKSEQKELAKREAYEAIKNQPTQIPEASVTPSPSPTPIPTATPTPIPEESVSFNVDDFWDNWYSTDGLVSINIYNISQESVSFSFAQTDSAQSQLVSADITAEVAGNAASFSFTDSAGNASSGSLTFDNGQLYMRVTTESPVTSVYPNVNCVMTRTKIELATPSPTVTPTPAPTSQEQTNSDSSDYFFPESSTRYLTDDEVSVYSSDQLELAKNEIYARHGRKFVTDYIAEYFNGKSWYNGTIDGDTFDAQQSSIFNEYELANIQKIAEWEEKKASEGN